MSVTNDCRFIGNFTKDPVGITVKVGGEPKRKVNFTIAVNTYRSKDRDVPPVFVECDIWGNPAENLEKYCHKGDKIDLVGEYTVDVYPDKETGKNIYRSKFVVQGYELLTPKPKGVVEEETEEEEIEPEKKPAKAAKGKKAKAKVEPEPEPEDDEVDEDDDLPF